MQQSGLSLVISNSTPAAVPTTMHADQRTPWTPQLCGEHANVDCARCKGVGVQQPNSRNLYSVSSPCRCVAQNVARKAANTLRHLRTKLTSIQSTFQGGSSATLSCSIPPLDQSRSNNTPTRQDYLNYVADFAIILGRQLSPRQMVIWEGFVMHHHPWNLIGDDLGLSKMSFFNELYEIEVIIGKQLVERGLFPGYLYIHARSVKAVPDQLVPVRTEQPLQPPCLDSIIPTRTCAITGKRRAAIDISTRQPLRASRFTLSRAA